VPGVQTNEQAKLLPCETVTVLEQLIGSYTPAQIGKGTLGHVLKPFKVRDRARAPRSCRLA
jgi:hypothetical protein